MIGLNIYGNIGHRLIHHRLEKFHIHTLDCTKAISLTKESNISNMDLDMAAPLFGYEYINILILWSMVFGVVRCLCVS